jgi:hypothetical protein
LFRAITEALEPRRMLALSPAGAEFGVNQFTANAQSDVSIAADAAGNFVVTWTSSGQDGSGTGIYARRYDAAGNALGAEFRVNHFTLGSQTDPSIDMSDDGKFVVTWAQPDGSNSGIFARRFDASGNPVDAEEFVVHSDLTNEQDKGRVAVDADGDFAVVWRENVATSSFAIRARLFAANGTPRGPDFTVNSSTASSQDNPAVSMGSGGNFVVTWDGADASQEGVYARLFAADGNAANPEFAVNSITQLSQARPSVAMAAGGSFVVTWEHQVSGSSFDIHARRFDSAGAAQGASFVVNSATSGSQTLPEIAADADGAFLITWSDGSIDSASSGVGARRFIPNGDPQGAQFQVNTFTTGAQNNPSVAVAPDGDAIIAWTSNGQDGNSTGIFAQRYAYTNDPPTANAGGPYTIAEGQSLTLAGSGTDPDGDTLAFSWDVNSDGTFGDASGAAPQLTWTQLNALGIDDGPASFQPKVRADDGHGNVTTSAATTLEITNVAPRIAVSGNASVNEGSTYTLNLGAVTEPGDDTITRYLINWGDGSFDDLNGNPANTVRTHTYDDGPAQRNITIALFDDDGFPHADAGVPHPFVVMVENVAPIATFFNGGAVPEGSNGLVGFASQFDPSSGDMIAGFRYSYDFNNDGDFNDARELADVVNQSVGVPDIYLMDGPGNRVVRARIKDRNGGFTDYTTTIPIINVTPSVNAGPDINTSATIPLSQFGTFTDTGADAPWTATVDYDWHTGDNDAVPLPLSGFTFTLNHTYAAPGTYTIRVFVKDKDNATGFDDVTVNVAPAPTLQVNQFLFNASGFTLRFNRPIDPVQINLYDGLDGVNPSSDPADLTLVGQSSGSVRGSILWNPQTNIATFVRTGGPLLPDNYTLTVRSTPDGFADGSGNLLDGNGDGTAGDDYVQQFTVPVAAQRTVSVPDFARGPNAAHNINIPNTGALGLPVRLDDGAQVRSVDFTLTWDPALLNVTAAQLAAGLPSDWSITANLTTPGQAIITVFGTGTDLNAGPVTLVKLVGHVPNTATYGHSGLLRINNVTISRNDGSTLPSRGESAIQQVAFFGDVDGDQMYTGFDAALTSRVVVGLDSGFHAMRLTDPTITADINGSDTITGIDASLIAQKAAGLPRPEIPDLPPPPLHNGGGEEIPRQISAPDDLAARPGGSALVPLNIDEADDVLGFNVTLDYDTNLLDVLDDVAGASPAVTLGSLFSSAGGWSLTANVDDAAGTITLVFWRSSGELMPPGGGTFANVAFDVSGSAPHDSVIPIDVAGSASVGGLMFAHDDGSIRVDAVAPDVVEETYAYQTAPHKISFKFSENVQASLAAGDFVVRNLTTNTTIPASQFTLTYDAATNTATLAYNGNVLPDGDYRVTIAAADVADAAGNTLGGDHAFEFFFLMADANHDRVVNLSDFNILASNFGQANRNFTQGDFNYDGTVNLQDFNILAARFGTSLPAQRGPAVAQDDDDDEEEEDDAAVLGTKRA